MHALTGPRRWASEEFGSDGIHQCRVPTSSNIGVPGGVVYGEPRGDNPLGHSKVRERERERERGEGTGYHSNQYLVTIATVMCVCV